MKRALVIITGLGGVCGVAYLSWLNPTAVALNFSPTRTITAPLAVLIVFAFAAGALLIGIMAAIQAGRRAVTAWRYGRRQRRGERIDAWTAQGRHLLRDGEQQQGRAVLQKAWRRQPEEAGALLALVESLCDTGEWRQATVLLEDSTRRHHTDPDILLALAETHRRAGNAAAAIEVLERVRALHPRWPRALAALRDRYVEAARWSDAATVQDALMVELRDADTIARQGDVLTTLRYRAAAEVTDPNARVEALEALADRHGAVLPILIGLGDSLAAADQPAEASVVWERALRTTPRTVAVDRLVGIATDRSHRERVRMLLRRLRTDQVRLDNIRLLVAEILLADGQVDEAAQHLDAIQAPTEAPALLHTLWGDVYRRRGLLEQAAAAYGRGDSRARRYSCRQCARTEPLWQAVCPTCGEWDSYRASVEIGLS
jgi:tetratricopeptide (TPR) repeat protein